MGRPERTYSPARRPDRRHPCTPCSGRSPSRWRRSRARGRWGRRRNNRRRRPGTACRGRHRAGRSCRPPRRSCRHRPCPRGRLDRPGGNHPDLPGSPDHLGRLLPCRRERRRPRSRGAGGGSRRRPRARPAARGKECSGGKRPVSWGHHLDALPARPSQFFLRREGARAGVRRRDRPWGPADRRRRTARPAPPVRSAWAAAIPAPASARPPARPERSTQSQGLGRSR
jgi:hypothetical protein